MLTVIREMAEEAERPEVARAPRCRRAALVDRPRRRRRRADARAARHAARRRCRRRGRRGLVELARGVLHGLTGEPLPEVADVVEELTEESIHQEESARRFCTVFVVEGNELDLDGLHATLEPSATRCWSPATSRSRRSTSTPTSRSARSTSGAPSAWSTRCGSRSATCTARPPSGSAGSRSSRRPRPLRRRPPRSSPSRREAGTGTSFAAKAR